jgi:arylsulfatase A-like enzyme
MRLNSVLSPCVRVALIAGVFISARVVKAQLTSESPERPNILVIFTSDNGPWSNAQESLGRKHNGQIAWGSSGPLREAKGSTYEGGLRVPCIARWPNRVPAGRTSDAIFATIDFMPTFAALTGYSIPDDRIIDGVDQTQLLLGQPAGNRVDYFYFCKGELHAVRKGICTESGWQSGRRRCRIGHEGTAG